MLQYMLIENILVFLGFHWCDAALHARPDNSIQQCRIVRQTQCMSLCCCPLYGEALHRTVVLTKQYCCSTLDSRSIEVK